MAHINTTRILILDDDTFILKLLTRMLSNLGFTAVSCYENGADALKQLTNKDTQPDLILLDLNMPGMDGIEFIRYMVEAEFSGSLILISGEGERMLQTTEKLVRAHQIPILGYLQKPVQPAALQALLTKLTNVTEEKKQATERSTIRGYSAEAVRKAIHTGQLVNYYQPKVRVDSGAIAGVETLVRWQHPTEGVVYPDQFIGIAEANDLIDQLTQVVLKQAFTQAAKWHQTGLALDVSVNVSMDNLASLDFQDVVIDLATEAGVAFDKIVLEITESQLMGDIRVSLEILTRLRLKRFRLSIDDFGTGHSSLAQLRDIPFDELKIDHGFVHRAAENETLRAIYDASLALARQLNMDAVAEGVENRADWNLLRQTGCDLAQGDFIARPMPAADLADWMTQWSTRIRAESLVDDDGG